MPNHITNKVTAAPEVLSLLINAEGKIDFSTILPFTGTFEWDSICCDAEDAAALVSGNVLSDHPLLAALQADTRKSIDIRKLSDEAFDQFVQMVRNKRACGHFHTMDFATEVWGTKWNAYSQNIDLEAGELSFETAWSCPRPVFTALSARHPEAEIVVRFADEDIGSNCGTITFKGGAAVSTDEAACWDDMTQEQRQHWKSFALDLTGRTEDPDEDEDE